MNNSLRVRLSIMMFLEYMVWGTWNITLGSYLDHLGFSGFEIGSIFGAFFLACLISPFIGGQFADRIMPTQIFMAIVHFLGGFLLLWLGSIQEYQLMWWVMFVYSLLYAPTLALTNSICFHHLKNTEKDFGAIRAWGTFGWIVAGLLLTYWWTYVYPFPVATWDELKTLDSATQAATRGAYLSVEGWIFSLAGVVSLIFGVFCLFLPHTPPTKEKGNPLAFIDALKLMKDKNFAIFLIICFVVSTELMFFYIPTPSFLQSEGINIQPKNVSSVMTIFGQGAEALTLFLLLPYLLPKLGVGKALALGVIAWPIRYAIFSLGYPWWLVVAALSLHGLCYVFFFVVGQIYVDTVAPKEIRASAQSLFTTVTFGLGLTFGSWFVGVVQDLFTTTTTLPDGSVESAINYQGFFLVPCVLTVICAVLFLMFFQAPPKKEGEAQKIEV